MTINKDISRSSPTSARQAPPPLDRRKLALQLTSPAFKKRRHAISLLSVLLLILLIFAAVRLGALASATNDQLVVQIGNQQVATVDLRQNPPISPDLFGANTFPQFATSSFHPASGSIHSRSSLPTRLVEAHINLLRFPGGTWGEQHDLSLDQLSDFSSLLQEINADGMLQVRLSEPIHSASTSLKDVRYRANIAGRWVDFMNNPRSDQRIAKYAHTPFHPIKFWTVGDEPDQLINPATSQKYTVADYVSDFITFSTIMHQNDPTIKVFGPEISQFYGPGAGPGDAHGQLWMEGFLQGMGAYEQNHPELKYHLLDGISFHAFQPRNAVQDPFLLLSSTDAWNYLLPLLRQSIAQTLKREVPIAITEINTNPPGQPSPSRGLAALWWADTLGTLMNQQVEYAAFSSLSGVDFPYPLFMTQSQQPTPMYRVMEIFSHLQLHLIPMQVQREPISLYATQDATHQTVSLLFINKSATTQLAQISAVNQVFTLSPWPALDLSLPGYSMVVITLHRSASAEAFSYMTPTSNDASAPLVIHTKCGHKTAALANNMPCL